MLPEKKKIVIHRKANKKRSYLDLQKNIAEGDLVNIWNKHYMFHPGGFFTLLMAMPMFYFYWATWFLWKKVAWPYGELLKTSNNHGLPIVLEFKNVTAEEVDELPESLEHIDTYDLSLANSLKKKFGCRISIHTLWANENGCLLLKSDKGYFRWHTWQELESIDIITLTYQLSSAWFHDSSFWQRLRKNCQKTIILGGGFQGGLYKILLAKKFNACIDHVDGWYSR